jgi:hypothetical protein
MSRRRKDAKATPSKTVGYGYVGRWDDGTLGWCTPAHVQGTPGYNEPVSELGKQNAAPDQRFYLCRITVEMVTDSRGRKITRRASEARRGQ